MARGLDEGTTDTAVLPHEEPPRRGRVLVAHAGTRIAVGGALRRIGDAMRAQGLHVDVVPARAVRDVTAYDAVVIGSAVARRRWHRHARGFVRRHADALVERPVWLFSCLEPGRSDRGSGHVRGMRRRAQRLEARGHEVFDASQLAAVSPFVARPTPTATSEGAGDPSVIDRWGERVGGAIAWEHHVRRDVIRGTTG